MDLYRFDEQIRFVLFKAIARIEIKLRSRLDHIMSSFSNNPFWYLDNQWFRINNNNSYVIDSIRNRISNEFSNTKKNMPLITNQNIIIILMITINFYLRFG
ncbi:Abi family protein [Providencia rettgeri]|nr:Abi family protein [Providencia rettgeri]